MRHISILIAAACLLACPLLVQAASWQQVSGDMFVEADAITRSHNAVHTNVKYIYDAKDGAKLQKTLKSKVPPHHSVQRKNFYCNSRQVSTSSYTYYSAADEVIAKGLIQVQQKLDVVPGSRIEPVLDFVCRQR